MIFFKKRKREREQEREEDLKTKNLLLKTIDTLEEKVEYLSRDNRDLGRKIAEMENQKADPKYVLNKITKDGLQWFDFNKLSPQDLRTYFGDAKMILENKTFQNEFNRIVSEWADWAFKQAGDFDEVRDMRMSANGLIMFRQYLESIPNPHKPKTREEINEAI